MLRRKVNNILIQEVKTPHGVVFECRVGDKVLDVYSIYGAAISWASRCFDYVAERTRKNRMSKNYSPLTASWENKN